MQIIGSSVNLYANLMVNIPCGKSITTKLLFKLKTNHMYFVLLLVISHKMCNICYNQACNTDINFKCNI